MSEIDERTDVIMAHIEHGNANLVDVGALCGYIRHLRRDLLAAKASHPDAERLLAGLVAVADEMRVLLAEVADGFVLTPVMQQRIKDALTHAQACPALQGHGADVIGKGPADLAAWEDQQRELEDQNLPGWMR